MIEALIQKHLRHFSGKSILDVGPGYAHFSRVAARTIGAKRITFADCDPAVLDWQAQKCRENSIEGIMLLLSLDADGLSKVNGPFDLIHCQEVLEHLPNPDTTLRRLVQLLAPRGRMIITTPTKLSERWLKFINPSYMKDEPLGHINQFSRQSLHHMLTSAGLDILVFEPTQPHYFISHTWLFGTRMKIEGSSGRIMSGKIRATIFNLSLKGSKALFTLTGSRFWGRIFPRNYFVVATPHENPR